MRAQGYAVNPSCYTPGSSFPVARTRLGTIGIMICFDRQLPEVARALRLADAQLLIVPAYGEHDDANTTHDGHNTRMLQTRAYENEIPLVFCE
jgi:predicted amidohydrolase